jgi:hypothetical protein
LRLFSGQDYRGGAGAAVTTAWNLLQNFVSRLEKKGETKLYKAVVTKLMSLGAFLPAWLVASYKLVNPAELLRLYLVSRLKLNPPNSGIFFR